MRINASRARDRKPCGCCNKITGIYITRAGDLNLEVIDPPEGCYIAGPLDADLKGLLVQSIQDDFTAPLYAHRRGFWQRQAYKATSRGNHYIRR
ncbi:hypothetical protein A9513_016340 [Pseudomonas sp. AU12215]|nr:hypothetical protein A9513_016340 [Pseudomonas sp. AU12215]